MLKKFEYNNTTLQRDEVVVYAFHPDVLAAPTKEIERLKAVILQYYPRTEHEGMVKPFTENTDYYQQWREAHDHVAGILSKRWSKTKFFWTTAIASATLFVLIWTLIDTVVHRVAPVPASPTSAPGSVTPTPAQPPSKADASVATSTPQPKPVPAPAAIQPPEYSTTAAASKAPK